MAFGWRGLSRMKGNFHVRFLGGRGLATTCAYPIDVKFLRVFAVGNGARLEGLRVHSREFAV